MPNSRRQLWSRNQHFPPGYDPYRSAGIVRKLQGSARDIGRTGSGEENTPGAARSHAIRTTSIPIYLRRRRGLEEGRLQEDQLEQLGCEWAVSVEREITFPGLTGRCCTRQCHFDPSKQALYYVPTVAAIGDHPSVSGSHGFL